MEYMTKYNVIIEQDEDGTYIGRVPELKGCVTQGSTIEELMGNMKEAVELYLESDSGHEKEKIRFIGVRQVEVV